MSSTTKKKVKAAGKKTTKQATKKSAEKKRLTLHVMFQRQDELVLALEQGVTVEDVQEWLQHNSTVYEREGQKFEDYVPGGGSKLLATVVDRPSTVDEEVLDVEVFDEE